LIKLNIIYQLDVLSQQFFNTDFKYLPKQKFMKKLHLQSFLLILLGLLSSNLFAQEPEIGKIKEIYLSGNPFKSDNFGLQYKSETKKDNFFRIGLTNLNFDLKKWDQGSSIAYNSTSTNISGAFDIGLETRKKLTEKFIVFYGINFTTSVVFQRSKIESTTLPLNLRHTDTFNINPGFGFNSGFILNITRDISISAEIIPTLVFNYTSIEGLEGSDKIKTITTGASLNLDNQSALISLVYRWGKNKSNR